MREYLKSNYQLILLCLIWVGVGMVFNELISLGIIFGSVLLLRKKLLYQELFIAFIVLLIFSDSREHEMEFAKSAKSFYILILFLFLLFSRKDFQINNNLFILFLPFITLSFFLIPFSYNWTICLQKTFSYAALLIITPTYIIKIFEEKGSAFFRDLIFTLALVLFTGLILKYFWTGAIHADERFRGIFGNPNGLGLYCIFFFLLLKTVENYFSGMFNKWDRIFLYSVIFLSVIFSSSRNSIISILIFLLFMRIAKMSPYFTVIIFIAILFSYEYILSNSEQLIYRLGFGDYFRISTLETGSGRNVAWTFAWEKIQDNFFFGKGFSYDIAVFYTDDAQHRLNLLGHQGNAHNSILSIWLNTGIVGLVLFMIGFILTFIKCAKNTIIALPIMFSVLFSATFESWMVASLNPITIQLWIILTIMISSEFNILKNENSLPLH